MLNLCNRYGVTGLLSFLMLLIAPLEAQERARRNPYTSPADVAMGKRLYRPLCSNCHGQDGKGVIGLAPGLLRALQHVSSDAEIFDILITGIAGTSMPAFSFTERQAWELVSFVRSIGGRAGDSVDGDVAAGESLFRGACIRCHRIGNEGGRSGPDLVDVAASTPADELRLSIKRPSEIVSPRHYRVRAVTPDGIVIEGVRLNEDSFSVQILDTKEHLISLDKTALKEYSLVRESPMPSFENSLTEKELNYIIAYLRSQVPGEEQ